MSVQIKEMLRKEQVMLLAMTFAETWWIWLIVFIAGFITCVVVGMKSLGTVQRFDFNGHISNMKGMAVVGGLTFISIVLLVVSLLFKFLGQS